MYNQTIEFRGKELNLVLVPTRIAYFCIPKLKVLFTIGGVEFKLKIPRENFDSSKEQLTPSGEEAIKTVLEQTIGFFS